jgi:uncharacterized membrane protein
VIRRTPSPNFSEEVSTTSLNPSAFAGKDKQWEAEITQQIPDKRIAWVSVDGTRNTGELTFESMELERTLITLTMEYEPEGFLEMAGDYWVSLRAKSKKT